MTTIAVQLAFSGTGSETRIFSFSDDIGSAKRCLGIPGKVSYVGRRQADYVDLCLMSRCKHNVTTDFSSFSWWAAYLNPNPEKSVLRLQHASALNQMNRVEDFYPKDWVVVPS